MVKMWRGCAKLVRHAWLEDKRRFSLAAVLVLGQATALPLAAAGLGRLTDAAVDGAALTAAAAALAVALLVIVSLTLGHFAHIAYFELAELTALRFDSVLARTANASAGIQHHEQPDYADKLQVLRQELQRVGWTSMQALLPAIGLVAGIGVTAVLLARLSPWLLMLPLAAIPPLLAGKRAESMVGHAREAAAGDKRRARHLLRLSTDTGAAKELRVGNLREDLSRRHNAAWESASRIMRGPEIRAGLLRAAGQLAFAVGYVAATLLVIREAVAGRRSVGDVVLVIVLAAQVNHQVSTAVQLLHDLQRTSRALVTLEWAQQLVVASAPAVGDAPVPPRLERGLRLRNVAFRYPGTDRVVLSGVSVDLRAGTTVALVGENGAGKTTLVKLLCRFYDVTSGSIEVDGVDIRTLPMEPWRQQIAIGFQDFARLEFRVRESVGVGDLPQVDSAEAVAAALVRARAEDVPERLDKGLETPIGTSHPDGSELSKGQWQKLALGRAMMRPTPLLLILDEPTSALDAESEHRLFGQYLQGARRVAAQVGGITLLVSHRFSTVQSADLILVFRDGRLTEVGDHHQLISAGGLYAELYRLQADAYHHRRTVRPREESGLSH